MRPRIVTRPRPRKRRAGELNRVQRPTLRDVAQRAGVSTAAVSYVLNNRIDQVVSEETRQRVFEAVRELEYAPDARARNLALNRTFTVGVGFYEVGYLAIYAFALTLAGVAEAMAEAGFSVQPVITGPESSPGGEALHYLKKVRDRSLEGLIIFDAALPASAYQTLSEEGVPWVCMGHRLAGFEERSVSYDLAEGFRTVARHLVDLGHRSIAYAGSLIGWKLDHFRVAREAFVQAVEAPLKLDARADRSECGLFLQPIGETTAEAREALHRIIEYSPPPTALFIDGTTHLLCFLEELDRLGIQVPEDLSIAVHCDDQDPHAEALKPRMTVLQFSNFRLGCEAGKLVLRLLADEPPAEPLPLLPLVFRPGESTGPPSGCMGRGV